MMVTVSEWFMPRGLRHLCRMSIHPLMHKFLLLLCILLPITAMAEEPAGTLVSLSAEAAMTVPNDEVLAVYRVEASGKVAATLRKQVNSIAQAVSRRLQGEPGAKLTTIGRRMEPVWRYDNAQKRQVRDGWRLVQTEQVRSGKLDRVAEWLDDIEKAGAQLDSLSFVVSEQAALAAQEKLRMQAIAEFRRKAAAIAHGLDAASYRIQRLQTDQQMPVYPVMRNRLMATASDSVQQPSLNSGESRIRVTVRGEVVLPFRDFPAQ